MPRGCAHAQGRESCHFPGSISKTKRTGARRWHPQDIPMFVCLFVGLFVCFAFLLLFSLMFDSSLFLFLNSFLFLLRLLFGSSVLLACLLVCLFVCLFIWPWPLFPATQASGDVQRIANQRLTESQAPPKG